MADEFAPRRPGIDFELRLAELKPTVDALVQRVQLLENKGSDMWQTLASLETATAVQTKMLEQLVQARAEDSSRTRAIFMVILPLVSVGVTIILAVTR